jgi:hypothetical protein
MFCPRKINNPLHFQNQRYIFLCPKEEREREREKERKASGKDDGEKKN